LGAAFPKPVFAVTEDGIQTLKAAKLVKSDIPVFPELTHWDDVQDVVRTLTEKDHPYKTLVLDTAGGFERLCHEQVCWEHYKGDWGEKGFQGYQRGFETALASWREFLNSLDRLRDAKNMSVLLLDHSTVAQFKNPADDDYDRFTPCLHRKTWALTSRWTDLILFCNYYVEVEKERKGDRPKGKGGKSRMMHTEFDAAFEAKNRHNLPAEIDMGNSGAEAFANLMAAIKEGRK